VTCTTASESQTSRFDPVMYPVGASVTVARHWGLLLEAGANFDDARLFVLSASYRF
jgi:hypothetical protein